MAQYGTNVIQGANTTVTTTAASNIITGSVGCEWSTGDVTIAAGDLVYFEGYENSPLTITTVDTDVQITLTANFPVALTDADYTIVTDFTGTSNLPLLNARDRFSAGIYTEAMRRLAALIGAATSTLGSRARIFAGAPSVITGAGNALIYQKEIYYDTSCTISRISVDCNGLATAVVGDSITFRVAVAQDYTVASPTIYQDITLTGEETKGTASASLVVAATSTVYVYIDAKAGNPNHQDIQVEIQTS